MSSEGSASRAPSTWRRHARPPTLRSGPSVSGLPLPAFPRRRSRPATGNRRRRRSRLRRPDVPTGSSTRSLRCSSSVSASRGSSPATARPRTRRPRPPRPPRHRVRPTQRHRTQESLRPPARVLAPANPERPRRRWRRPSARRRRPMRRRRRRTTPRGCRTGAPCRAARRPSQDAGRARQGSGSERAASAGTSPRSWLGTFVGARTDGGPGARVLGISVGSPAAKANVMQDDVILAIDGRTITNPADIQQVLGHQSPGTTVTLQILRAGQRQLARRTARNAARIRRRLRARPGAVQPR